MEDILKKVINDMSYKDLKNVLIINSWEINDELIKEDDLKDFILKGVLDKTLSSLIIIKSYESLVQEQEKILLSI